MSSSDVFDRYMAVLGLEESPPGSRALSALVRAHLTRVPFENISKLFLHRKTGATTIPMLDDYLDGISRFNLGGTCYANNVYLFQLMRNLGYDVRLCGAHMSKPNVHAVSVVRLNGREYLVDVGYGAPFSSPMPRDLDEDFIVNFGRDRYVLRPQDGAGRSAMDHYRDNTRVHGYVVEPTSRSLGDFEEVIRGSYRREATFMNAVALARFYRDRVVRIRNLSIIESTSEGETETRLEDRDALIDAVRRIFGIPGAIVRFALDGLDRLVEVQDLE